MSFVFLSRCVYVHINNGGKDFVKITLNFLRPKVIYVIYVLGNFLPHREHSMLPLKGAVDIQS